MSEFVPQWYCKYNISITLEISLPKIHSAPLIFLYISVFGLCRHASLQVVREQVS